MASGIRQIVGELAGGAAGLIVGAWVILPAFPESWVGYLGALSAIVVGAIIGHQVALQSK